MEKLFGVAICFLFLQNCSNKAEQKSEGILVSEKTEISFSSKDTTVLPSIKFANPYRFDTILIFGHSIFRIFRDTNSYSFRILKKVRNEWLDNIDNAWTSLHEFQDWNKDGHVDIVLRYKSAYDILLFNPQKQVFIGTGYVLGNNIEDFQEIEGTNLRCSFYTSKGNWHSELFEIGPNYIMRSYGVIFYRYNFNEETQIDSAYIDVYKRLIVHDEAYREKIDWNILGDQKELIMTIDPKKQKFYNAEITGKQDSSEMEFVKDYWSKNYQKFIKK